MKKIMVLGATGMAGHVVSTYLEELGKYEIINLCHTGSFGKTSYVLDVKDKKVFSELTRTINPDIIINCIGILPKQAEAEPATAIYANSFFPRFLEETFYNTSTKIIHLSTDCVFSGKKGNYNVDDFRDADDIYGRTKALGEINNPKDLTIRTSIIGPELKQDGTGLFNWFMKQKGVIYGYSKVFWTGLTTVQLARVIEFVVENNLSGLKQIVPAEKISKYHLLLKFKEVFNKNNVEIQQDDKKISDKSLIPSEGVTITIPNYKDMLIEMKEWILKYREKFKSYNHYIY